MCRRQQLAEGCHGRDLPCAAAGLMPLYLCVDRSATQGAARFGVASYRLSTHTHPHMHASAVHLLSRAHMRVVVVHTCSDLMHARRARCV